jgi:hypothetical protein
MITRASQKFRQCGDDEAAIEKTKVVLISNYLPALKKILIYFFAVVLKLSHRNYFH